MRTRKLVGKESQEKLIQQVQQLRRVFSQHTGCHRPSVCPSVCLSVTSMSQTPRLENVAMASQQINRRSSLLSALSMVATRWHDG